MSSSAGVSHQQVGGHDGHLNHNIDYNTDYDQTSFLFVVNKLCVKFDENLTNGDCWYNRIPPTEPSGYEREIPSRVMRYENGQVTEAFGDRWAREGPQGGTWPPGRVCATDAHGRECHPTMYKQMAVFSCNPLLPIVVVNGDPLSAAEKLARSPLLFFHPPSQPGVSQAVHPDSLMDHGPPECKYVAGASPSWIPSLVPETYRNPHNVVPSVGLAGELPIVLGLMAFSLPTEGEAEESVTRTFLSGLWQNGQWHHTGAPQGYALSASDHPRGFLIAIFYDPKNPYSTQESISNMERNSVIVRDFWRA
ncbi:hypothetical protein TARUN_6073 [Trichoderma arundinaceum]|uniref:Uncharacterized protein n=1 Tax=Trichoderma arundinaceum TaxID=490622 RepID=A0A395NJC2_TRIAR|nr:hypothetical protein TARUN_6073 [Trichoderma arundinaceum]